MLSCLRLAMEDRRLATGKDKLVKTASGEIVADFVLFITSTWRKKEKRVSMIKEWQMKTNENTSSIILFKALHICLH